MLDRRFFDVNLIVQGIANEPADNPTKGTQYIIGENPAGDFENAEAGQLARYNGSKWIFSTPKEGDLEVINIETGKMMRFDGVVWEDITDISGSGGGDEIVAETHMLTAAEATAKSFTLANSIKSGKEDSVVLSVCGVVQIPGSDYIASGNSISWNAKTLDDIGLQAGDVFLVQYVKA